MSRRDEKLPARDQLTASDLVHPIYLDVPMMVSFLAAVEDGASFENESRTVEGAQSSKEREGGGGLKMPALMSMFAIDASGRYKNQGADSTSSEVTTLRRHTEASLFNLLRARLDADGAVTRLTDDASLGELKAGDLVEVAGGVSGNPLQQILDLLERVAPYMGLDLDKPGGKRSDTRGQNQNKQKGNQPSRQARQQEQQHQAEEEPVLNEEDLRLFMTMREDLDKAHVRDLVLDGPGDIKAVLTLSREFLHTTSEEYLLGGHFKVLGKVTRVLKGDDYINLTRRTALGLMGPELARETVSSMQDNPHMVVEVSDPVVEVPGVQLLPLAIFS